MAKKVETETAGEQRSSVAMKKTEFNDLVGKVLNAETSKRTANDRKKDLIDNAAGEKNLHRSAFSWHLKLRKMDPVKRNELLFHFEVYNEHAGFLREDLALGDREASAPSKAGDGESDEEDLRPTFLKQPGASVTSSEAVDKIKADALAKVGRGPDPKPN